MKTYTDKVKLTYKLLSKIYDLLDLVFFSNKMGNPRLGLAKAIPNDHISVIDICCGTGNSMIAIASQNKNNKITGIDLSRDMLKVAQRKLKKISINNAFVQEMDATKIQLEDNSIDIATTSLCLHEMSKDILNKVLSEMSRITKVGGRVCIIEWDKPPSKLGGAFFGFFPTLFEPKGFRDFIKLDWSNLLSVYGLKIIEVKKYSLTKLIIACKE